MDIGVIVPFDIFVSKLLLKRNTDGFLFRQKDLILF